jgi:hypothetical protein
MCSLEEAYGSEFANQLNQKKEECVSVEDYEYIDDNIDENIESSESPKEFLYKSIDAPKKMVLRQNPKGHLQNNSSYSLLNQSSCNDYFFHIDTCKDCQRRLQKRIVNYLQSRKVDIQNGASGVQIASQLFEDPDTNSNEENIYKNDTINNTLAKRKWDIRVKEGFENPLPNCLQTRPLYILLFGLFVIFVLDRISSK